MSTTARRLLIGLVVVAGIAAQLVITAAAWERLTYEELAESIRNPWWIAQGEIYDGISSNVVFYKLNDLYYAARGFHMFAAKELRFVLAPAAGARPPRHCCSFCCCR